MGSPVPSQAERKNPAFRGIFRDEKDAAEPSAFQLVDLRAGPLPWLRNELLEAGRPRDRRDESRLPGVRLRGLALGVDSRHVAGSAQPLRRGSPAPPARQIRLTPPK